MSEFLNAENGEQGKPEEGKSLRAFAEAQAAENAALKAELATVKQTLAAQSFKSIWDGLDVQVPEKTRAFYTGEADPEAVKKWVADNQDVFRFEAKTTEGAEGDGGTDNAEAIAQQAALDAAQGLGRDKTHVGYAASIAQLKEHRNSPTRNEADLDKALSFLPD
jgi:hypothetical protein